MAMTSTGMLVKGWTRHHKISLILILMVIVIITIWMNMVTIWMMMKTSTGMVVRGST